MCFTFQGALSVLLQGHELELVVAVGRLLGSEVPQGDNTDAEEINCVVETAVRYLTYRAIRLSLWDLAIELAQTLPEVSYPHLTTTNQFCYWHHLQTTNSYQ